MPEAASTRGPRPVSVWIIYVVHFLQGTTVILVTLLSVIGEESEVLDAAGTIALAVLLVLSGLILVLLGFLIFQGSASVRTPSLVLQLLLVVLSFSFFAGGAWATGLVFMVPAAAALVLLFIRPTQAWLEADQGS